MEKAILNAALRKGHHIIPMIIMVNRAITFPTKYTEMISTMCHGVRLALLIPKQFLFKIFDLAKLCL